MFDKQVDVIIPTRMTSSRLPGKVLYNLYGIPVLQHIIQRLRMCEKVDNIVVALTSSQTDQPIIDLCNKIGCSYTRGSEEDVLHRVIKTGVEIKSDIIVEVTSDCPMVDPHMVDFMIQGHLEKMWDNVVLTSNVINRTFPRGYDIQVVNLQTLKEIYPSCNEYDKQHVTSYLYLNPDTRGKYNIQSVEDDYDNSNIRLTLDCEADYEILSLIFNVFKGVIPSHNEVVKFLKKYPDIININSHIKQKNYYEELAKYYAKREG